MEIQEGQYLLDKQYGEIFEYKESRDKYLVDTAGEGRIVKPTQEQVDLYLEKENETKKDN